MLRLVLGQAARGKTLRAGAPRCRARTAATFAQLQHYQETISPGLRARLAALAEAGDQASEQAHVAVVGYHSPEFAAVLRAARAAGAAVAPVDLQVCEPDDLTERLAELKVDMAITSVSGKSVETTVMNTARRLGAAWASVASLHQTGIDSAAALEVSEAKAAAPLFLFSKSPSSSAVRAACIPDSALSSRIASAVSLWGMTSDDTVLSLGLRSDVPEAVVDALEAPLAVGAAVAMPQQQPSRALAVWDLWAALRDEPAATIIFVAATWCQHLVNSYAELSAPLREEFSRRWAKQPFRHTVAVAAEGEVPSSDLAESWAEIFGSPLTWHFSCPEAGSLYVVDSSDRISMQSAFGCQGTDWSLSELDGELLVRREGVFQGYHDRPRSTSEAFTEDGFCRTGHRAILDNATGALRPQPVALDYELEQEVHRHLYRGPRWEKLGMEPNWTVKKVLMRKYWYWKPKKGYPIITKKDLKNCKNLVYRSRYKN